MLDLFCSESVCTYAEALTIAGFCCVWILAHIVWAWLLDEMTLYWQIMAFMLGFGTTLTVYWAIWIFINYPISLIVVGLFLVGWLLSYLIMRKI